MKKNTIITFGVAGVVVAAAICGLIISMNMDKHNQSNKMERVSMNASQLDTVRSDSVNEDTGIEEDTVNDTTNDSKGKSFTMEFDGIKFTVNCDIDLEDEEFEIPLKSAIYLGLSYIKDTYDTTFNSISVNMDTTSTSGIRNGSNSWNAVVELDSDKRYEITVNAQTGEVIEAQAYYKEDGADDKWVKAGDKLVRADNSADTSSKKKEYKVEKMNLDAFSDIEVDIEYNADVEIVTGDSYGVILHYYGPDYSIDYSNTDGKLKIEDVVNKKVNNFNFNNQIEANYVTIIVPKESKFSNIDIAVSSGDISLKDVQVDQIKTLLASGDSSFAEMSINKADIQTSSGDIKMKDIQANQIKTLAVSGDCSFVDMRIKEGDMQTSSGNIEVKEMQSNTANVTSTSGDIIVNGDVYGNNIFELTSGDIEIACSGKEKEYSYNLVTTSGYIEVAGEEVENEDESGASVSVKNSKKNIIKATITSGDIIIDFNKQEKVAK
ncbi:DUF4097 family beta strand repeat-containing protein [Anaerosporobacter sp.]